MLRPGADLPGIGRAPIPQCPDIEGQPYIVHERHGHGFSVVCLFVARRMVEAVGAAARRSEAATGCPLELT